MSLPLPLSLVFTLLLERRTGRLVHLLDAYLHNLEASPAQARHIHFLLHIHLSSAMKLRLIYGYEAQLSSSAIKLGYQARLIRSAIKLG